MALPELAPRNTIGGLIVVWVYAALAGIVVGVFVGPDWRAAWLTIALGMAVVLSFAVQLRVGRSQGFIRRTALSVLGAMVVMGVISLGFGLAGVVPG